ncbi:MAG TPA: phosphonopyruvate decarboxylase [Chitinophagaceae bacterium]|jgi:phosphonopyruvate decarboxylase|nr:phosphonopyruvate decarboxylase [Chitinophagaceae bacterium]
MISPERLYNYLNGKGVSFYTGVPDSLLKHFLKYIQDHTPADQHIITANEGLAVGLASGYYFSTGKLPLVYLQNSGLGNIINPLTSLADKEVYSVPMLLMIGWRGRPGTKDEPQHVKMGRITRSLLDTLEVPCYLLNEDEQNCFTEIEKAIQQSLASKQPVALLVPEEIFEKYKGSDSHNTYTLIRESVIETILERLKGDEIVVCTTGKSGREFYEQNITAHSKIDSYLLSVGGMGHANHIALGLQYGSQRKMIMIDGDGAVLMHMGSLATIGQYAKNDFIHIVINNGSHESVGGQPTAAFNADLQSIAGACGYTSVIAIDNEEKLEQWLSNGFLNGGVQFVEIRTNNTSRADLGRPQGQPVDWKEQLMKALQKK